MTEQLPEGIRTLRRLKVGRGVKIRPKTFDRIVGILERCGGNRGPGSHRCGQCRYLDECHDKLAALAGYVVKEKGKEQDT